MIYLLIILAICSQILQHTPYTNIFVNSYADDLLIMPIVFESSYIINVNLQKKEWHLPFTHLIVTTAMASVFFEGLLPYFDKRFTSDAWDAACYFTTAILWYIFKIKKTFK